MGYDKREVITVYGDGTMENSRVSNWDSKIGEIRAEYFVIAEEDIWKLFNIVYSSNSKNTTTYKYGLIKALISNLYETNENLELTFDQIFYHFTKIYWNLVVHHNLKQIKTNSAVERVLKEFQTERCIPSEEKFDNLSSEWQLELIKRVKVQAKKYVFGALHGDTKGGLYGFDVKQECFRFNAPVHSFMKKYQRVLTALTNYHFSQMLEKLNDIPNVYYLITKIENITRRTSMDQFYKLLVAYDENGCFYCGKTLESSRKQVHVDHFIPWSFVQTDSLWNLVLSCAKCNLSKNALLPAEQYLGDIVERNEVLIKIPSIPRRHFLNYNDEKIQQLYAYTCMNGYENRWKPVAR